MAVNHKLIPTEKKPKFNLSNWIGKVFRFVPQNETEVFSTFRNVVISFERYPFDNDFVYHRMVNFIMSATFNQGNEKHFDWLFGKCQQYKDSYKLGVYGKDAPYGSLFWLESYWKRNSMDKIQTPLHDIVDFLKNCGEVSMPDGSKISYQSFRNSGHSRDIFDDEIALTALDIHSFLSETCRVEGGLHVRLPEIFYYNKRNSSSNDFCSRIILKSEYDKVSSLKEVVKSIVEKSGRIQYPDTGFFVIKENNLHPVLMSMYSKIKKSCSGMKI